MATIILVRYDKDYPGYRIHLKFSRAATLDQGAGMPWENGLGGMLEAADYESVDIVSCFVRTIFGGFCKEYSTVLGTIVFTKYVEMIKNIYCRKRRSA